MMTMEAQRPSAAPVRPSAPLQSRLPLSRSGDRFEQEADRVGAHVMRTGHPTARGLPVISVAPVSISRHAAGSASPGEAAGSALETGGAHGAGQVLPDDARRFFEPRFGHDFSRVRIHTDAHAAGSARAIGARAFTIGSDIAFAGGEFAPHTRRGRALLAHELTHVVQQGGQPRAVMRAETDTSAGCDDLADTSADINTKINTALATARKSAGTSGVDVALGLYSQLGKNGSLGRTKIEDWAETLGAGKVRVPTQASTKYAGVSYGLWNPFFPILNPTMRVGAVCIGSDKLGHFLQQGMEYLETAAQSPTGGAAAAEKYGASTEAGGFGLKTTGVFSNADLEANRQGMRFYAALIGKPSLTFAIADYINASWNEEANPSHYEASVGLTVWSNLLKGTWAGSFTDTATPSGIPTVTVLKVTGGTSLVGGYSYTSSNGTPVTGTITKATIKHQKNALGAVTGVRIEYSWASGSNSGKGFWVSDGESRLKGRWGMGASATAGGEWNLSRDRAAEGAAARKKAQKP